ncbi:MAG: hypothetical protein M1818_008000 [Claussenomyces sp. TS43310]|nr:MAG: hypothetical protein M1818_008000 [Claussenomyces sp. TS43310]
MPPHSSETPAKKQSKWSPEEDALIIDLRGSGMKWEDISKRLPGRSAISCRLHYQNYLERRSEWDEERKNKLARLYERFKPEIWARVAEEMAVPWRAAEAMHWQLGEADMARRAGVVPFSLSNVNLDPTPGQSNPTNASTKHRQSPSRGQMASHQQYGAHVRLPGNGVGMAGGGPSRTIAARRDSTPRSTAPPPPPEGLMRPALGGAVGGGSAGQMGPGRGTQMLPSVAELTTGVSPYSMPAYAVSGTMSGGYATPGPVLPAIGLATGGGGQPRPVVGAHEGRSRVSPQMPSRETTRGR